MKKNILLKLSISILFANSICAQSNEYPTSGDVTIRNYSPQVVLQRNTDIGGFTSGIQTRLQNGTDNWFFGNLHTDSWIVSKGNYQNAKLTVLSNGNVGIGTGTPQAKLSIVPSANHMTGGQPTLRICEATGNENYGLGLSTYYNGSNYVGKLQQFHGGTPSDILLNPEGGNIGIGTTSPNSKLTIRSGGTGVSIHPSTAPYFGTLAFNRESQNGEIFDPNGQAFQINNGGGDKNLHFQVYNGNGSQVTNDALVINGINGNVGIGTPNTTSKLTVAGNIASREVKVTVDAGADFVFEKDYNLPSLDSVDKFIKDNKHLPEIASAKEMQKEGINLSEMNIKLLQKIEELTLYVIEQNKKINELEMKNKKYEDIENRLKKIESNIK